MNTLQIEEIVKRALAEDIGTGDITTSLTIPAASVSRAQIIAKEEGVIAGLKVAELVFVELGDVTFTPKLVDGDRVKPGNVLAEITGPTAVILTGERVALNFLQRMSGIATKTARLVELVRHTEAKILDTRKTTPGLRVLEKYAVKTGGGTNHRIGLYDAVLIKDNHIQAAGGVKEAIWMAKSGIQAGMTVEVEADTLDQVKEALEAGANMILLDNMSTDTIKQAVKMCKGRAHTEASGNVTENNVAEIAETGVDFISVGALTHSVKALDLSLDITD